MRQPKIEFISTVEGLSAIEEARPFLAKKAIPKWWKKMPMKIAHQFIDREIMANAKNCPSFPDYFGQGYIIPMWTDTILYYNDSTDSWGWRTASEEFAWDTHPNEQLLDEVKFAINGKKVHHVFKALSPWKIKISKGWTVMQIPLFYHYENEFTVMPGMLDPNVLGDLNQQVMITAANKEILIKRGTPFVQYVPIKKSHFKLNVRDANKKDKSMIQMQKLLITGVFAGSRTYNKEKGKNEKR